MPMVRVSNGGTADAELVSLQYAPPASVNYTVNIGDILLIISTGTGGSSGPHTIASGATTLQSWTNGNYATITLCEATSTTVTVTHSMGSGDSMVNRIVLRLN